MFYKCDVHRDGPPGRVPGKMQKGGHDARPILRPGEGARPGQER